MRWSCRGAAWSCLLSCLGLFASVYSVSSDAAGSEAPLPAGELAALHARLRVGVVHADGPAFTLLVQHEWKKLFTRLQSRCHDAEAAACRPAALSAQFKKLWLTALQPLPCAEVGDGDLTESRPLLDLLLSTQLAPSSEPRDLQQEAEAWQNFTEKLRTLSFYGLFFKDVDAKEESSLQMFSESDLGTLFAFLERAELDGSELRLLFIHFLKDLAWDLHPLWEEGQLGKAYQHSLALKLNLYCERVFAALLHARDWQAAAAWMRCMYSCCVSQGLLLFRPLRQPFGREGSGPVLLQHPLLEAILQQMQHFRRQVDEPVYVPELGAWKRQPLLDAFVALHFGSQPFNPRALEQLASLEKQDPERFRAKQWLALRQYLQAGTLRDQLCQLLGREELPRLLGSTAAGLEPPLHVATVVRYLNTKQPLFAELRVYAGLEQIFFYKGHRASSLVSLAVAARRYDEVCYLFFLLRIPLTERLEAGNTYLHLLLNQGKNPGVFASTQEETAILKILDFFLFSPSFPKEQRLQALLTVNDAGETPLLLAEKQGLTQVLKKMRALLLQETK